MKKNKKRIMSFILALWLMNNVTYDHKVSLNYQIVTNEEYYALYSRGKVYIGDNDYINGLTNINDNDILIIDNRDAIDPDIRILSSYKILDSNIRNEILNILSIYEKEHPSSWKRTISSMRVEWFVHNILYYLNYETNRTKDVDFNNEDEKVYKKRIIKNIIR